MDAGTSSLQHTQHPTNLSADVASDGELDDWQCAASSAALHQWLDEVIRLLLQYPPFNSAVLTAILLENQDANDMLQVSLSTCHKLALQIYGVGTHTAISLRNEPACQSTMMQDIALCSLPA